LNSPTKSADPKASANRLPKPIDDGNLVADGSNQLLN
jgi:hypothetical protein